MSSYINPIAELLKDLVKPADMARGTRLTYHVCYRVLHDPTASFNFETVNIVHEWVCKTFGYCALEKLFHPENISNLGRPPGTGVSLSHTVNVTICPHCHYQTNRRLPTCTICGKALG